MHPDNEQFPCEECGLAFVRRSWLLKHAESHTNTERATSFNEKHSLEAHQSEHSNDVNLNINRVMKIEL